MLKEIKEKALAALSNRTPHADEFFIMRHGRTALDPTHRSDGWLDFPLSDDGRVRLLKAEQFLNTFPIKRIYAPTLKRTTESADILSSGILSHPEVVPADDAKTWNFGVLAGTIKNENRPLIEHFMQHTHEAPDGGESRDAFRARFLPWLDARKAEAKADDGPIMAVLSGSNIREISFQLFENEDTLDLDEGGLLVMYPEGDDWAAEVVFGHKDEDNDWLS
jgi:broad specificity phosphatase PhoE